MDEIIQASMNIILNAGDARNENLEAINSIKDHDFEAARRHMETAESLITAAHKAQTDQIQAETQGKKSEYSLLFAHAQDTLMTINSEICLTRSLMPLFEEYESRLQALERECLKK